MANTVRARPAQPLAVTGAARVPCRCDRARISRSFVAESRAADRVGAAAPGSHDASMSSTNDGNDHIPASRRARQSPSRCSRRPRATVIEGAFIPLWCAARHHRFHRRIETGNWYFCLRDPRGPDSGASCGVGINAPSRRPPDDGNAGRGRSAASPSIRHGGEMQCLDHAGSKPRVDGLRRKALVGQRGRGSKPTGLLFASKRKT